MSNWFYVAFAYGLTWVVLAGYTLYLWSRMRRARELYESAAEETPMDERSREVGV